MSKKRIRDVDVLDLLDSTRETDEASTRAIDAELFGAIEQSDANRQSASPTSIFEIRPDLSQPRRTVPHAVRERMSWRGETARMEELFLTWEEMVNDERGQTKFHLSDYLDQREIGLVSEEDVETDRPPMGPLERPLVELVELATSIHNEGLTNPITVVNLGINDGYLLETGERRWLAYHMLYLHTGENKYAKIAARTVDRLNIWRQAAENNARTNLNAVSKARQFAVLLMGLLQEKKKVRFTSFSEFTHEQAYYAQVADGTDKKLRIPRGMSERLLDATGLKSRKQLREYRALLRLPHQVWDVADDLNWSERFIRDLVQEAHGDEDRLIDLAYAEAHKQGYSVPVGTVSTTKIKTRSKPKPKKKSQESLAPGTKQYYSRFVGLVRKAKTGKPEIRDEALGMVGEIRRWLDGVEQQLQKLDD